MAYRQYTSCAKPINYVHQTFGGYAYYTMVIGLIVAALINAYNVWVVPIAIGLLVILITFLVWWLYNRLICLGGEECAIGVVLSKGKPQPTKKAGDDDATMNILLAPGPTTLEAGKQEYWDNPVQGHLVKPNQAVLDIGRGYVEDEAHLKYVKALHCEFEGSGIRNVLAWASVILALLIASLLVPFPASLILRLLALLFTLLGGYTAIFDPLNPGDPEDINPNLGMLKKGDIVVVKGDWIYDSLHGGWNEIHAVHDCQVIGSLTEEQAWPSDLGNGLGLDTPEKVKDALGAWCSAIRNANEAEEGGSRDDPANNWVIHPLIDGCKPPPIIG